MGSQETVAVGGGAPTSSSPHILKAFLLSSLDPPLLLPSYPGLAMSRPPRPWCQ